MHINDKYWNVLWILYQFIKTINYDIFYFRVSILEYTIWTMQIKVSKLMWKLEQHGEHENEQLRGYIIIDVISSTSFKSAYPKIDGKFNEQAGLMLKVLDAIL